MAGKRKIARTQKPASTASSRSMRPEFIDSYDYIAPRWASDFRFENRSETGRPPLFPATLLASQASCHGLDQAGMRVVVFEGPKECSSESSGDARVHIVHFEACSICGVVSPEGQSVGVIDPLRDTHLVEVMSESGLGLQRAECGHAVRR